MRRMPQEEEAHCRFNSDTMKTSPLEIYGLCVCFVAVLAFAIALGTTLYTLIRLFSPFFTLGNWEYSKHLSNDAYWEKESTKNELTRERVRPSDEDLTQEREQSFTLSIQAERHSAMQGLVKQGIFLLVDTLLFLVHWLITQSFHT